MKKIFEGNFSQFNEINEAWPSKIESVLKDKCMVQLTTKGNIRMWPRFKLSWPMHKSINKELQNLFYLLKNLN